MGPSKVGVCRVSYQGISFHWHKWPKWTINCQILIQQMILHANGIFENLIFGKSRGRRLNQSILSGELQDN